MDSTFVSNLQDNAERFAVRVGCALRRTKTSKSRTQSSSRPLNLADLLSPRPRNCRRSDNNSTRRKASSSFRKKRRRAGPHKNPEQFGFCKF